MRKEDFVALGISEDLAEKAANASAEELKGFVPKARFNEVNTAKSNAEKSYSDVKAELDNLKASAGNNEALQAQINILQANLKDKDEKHAAEIKDMRITNAIQSAVSGTAQDTGLIATLLDRSKLTVAEDGKVTGIDEQVKALKESKPFLFKDDKYPVIRDDGEPGAAGSVKTRDQFASWVEQSIGGN